MSVIINLHMVNPILANISGYFGYMHAINKKSRDTNDIYRELSSCTNTRLLHNICPLRVNWIYGIFSRDILNANFRMILIKEKNMSNDVFDGFRVNYEWLNPWLLTINRDFLMVGRSDTINSAFIKKSGKEPYSMWILGGNAKNDLTKP